MCEKMSQLSRFRSNRGILGKSALCSCFCHFFGKVKIRLSSDDFRHFCAFRSPGLDPPLQQFDLLLARLLAVFRWHVFVVVNLIQHDFDHKAVFNISWNKCRQITGATFLEGLDRRHVQLPFDLARRMNRILASFCMAFVAKPIQHGDHDIFIRQQIRR